MKRFLRLYSALLPLILVLMVIPLYGQDVSDAMFDDLMQKQAKDALKQNLYSGSAHGVIDWERGYLVVTAYGAAHKGSTVNIADEKVQAIDAAYYNAIEKLSEILLGIRITANVTVRNISIQNSIIKQFIKGYLHNVDHLENRDSWEELPDGSWLARASVGVPLYGAQGFIPRLLQKEPAWQKITETPPIAFKPKSAAPDTSTQQNYTGLIIDCSKMAERPDLSVAPRILTQDGKSVYGSENVPRSVVLNGSLVWYANSLQSSVVAQKVGSYPLIVKPVGIDQNKKDHIIISQADANKIIWADQVNHFRDKARVLILF